MTHEERIEYEDFLKNSAISESMLETALLEGELRGEAKGEAKGEVKGELKKARFFAENLIIDGFSNQVISKYTGLCIEEIETLRKELN